MAERLRSKDTRKVLKFLQELYALREKDAFTSHLVSTLPGLIRAEAYTYNEMDHARGQASYKLLARGSHAHQRGPGNPRAFCRSDSYACSLGTRRWPGTENF